MSALRVLITNITLGSRTGTEINVRDLALGLLARGHTPIVYSPDLGDIARELHAATVPVVDDLRRVGVPPDVIHGHHHPETMMALLHFPGVPAVFFSHDFLAWHDAAPTFPRIRRYVAVDDTNRDRLSCEHGIPGDRISVLLNAVDLERFRPRGPLPPRPERALIFSNYAREGTHVGAVREACRRAGIPLDVIGAGAGAEDPAPERVLGQYDLVFAKGRCALEAVAVGAAVVLCDYPGTGPYVSAGELDRLRRLNFGRRLLQGPVDPGPLVREMARYDAADAAAVSRHIRATAGLAMAIDRLVELYREVIAEQAIAGDDLPAEERAAAIYLREWGPRFKDGEVRSDRDRLRSDCERLAFERDGLQRGHEALTRELDLRRADLVAAEAERHRLQAVCAGMAAERAAVARELAADETDLARLRSEREVLQRDLEWMRGTSTWRLRDFLLRSRTLAALYRTLRRIPVASSRRTAVQHDPAP